MTVILENTLTGETRRLEPLSSGFYPNFKSPWRAKETLANFERKEAIANYWKNYKFKHCSNCGDMGVYEAKG